MTKTPEEFGTPPKVRQPKPRNVTEEAIAFVIANWHVAGWRQMVAEDEMENEVAL